MTDITAIYNSNAFWAYVFSIYFLGTERWEVRKVLSVSLACIGVFIIAYGDSDELDHVTPPEGGMDGETKLARRLAPSIDIGSRLLGNLLALIGSLSFGLYEVWYKRYAALPDEMGAQVTVRRVGMTRSTSNATLLTPGRDRAARFYDRSVLGPDSAPEDDEQAATPATHEMPIGLGTPPPSRRPLTRTVSAASLGIAAADAYQTPPVVFLTHANFITSMIGVFTLLLLWVPIPILHFTGIEPFELPPNLGIVGSIIAMVICGVIFNCGFMLLLGLWGPVVASVGNLCTLVLVAIADTFVMSSALSMSALIGCGLIVGAFSVLLVDMLTSDPESKPAADVNEEVYALGDDDEDDDESVPADTTRP
ncbi:uncharacterized protein L969DRAFT_90121 [Mixia osmundae IAM 14324]|nr:uncharacterized protein L969DRAFT_90121 [Mixia osmundae IAM 14324]KEI37069.1 hypothetical protein L969DRAFT_90121 [Mixia osmundae IAM 14324]